MMHGTAGMFGMGAGAGTGTQDTSAGAGTGTQGKSAGAGTTQAINPSAGPVGADKRPFVKAEDGGTRTAAQKTGPTGGDGGATAVQAVEVQGGDLTRVPPVRVFGRTCRQNLEAGPAALTLRTAFRAASPRGLASRAATSRRSSRAATSRRHLSSGSAFADLSRPQWIRERDTTRSLTRRTTT